MKILKLLISFLICTSFCYCQKVVDIGVRINEVRLNNQKNEFDNFNLPNNSIELDRTSFSTDLILNLDLGKIRPRVWVGYERINGTRQDLNNLSNGGKTEFSLFHQISTFRFAAGIAKVISLKDLEINIGPELMFFSRFLEENRGVRKEFNQSGNLSSSRVIESEQPPYYSLGLGFFSTAYYPVWKDFSIGFEISNYFLFGKTSGNIIHTESNFDSDGNSTGTITKINNVDYEGFNTFFLNFSIGFRYAF